MAKKYDYEGAITRQTEAMERVAGALERIAEFFGGVTWAWEQADEETIEDEEEK